MVDGCEGGRRRTREQTESAKRQRHAHPPTREDLQRENERLRREVEDLQRKVAEREQQIGEAEKQIADLERQLAARQKNSTNSSKPPSSDGLAGNSRQRGRRKKSKRKVGGQKGHPGHHRRLVPPEQVQEVRPVLPVECKHCGQSLPQQLGQIQSVGEAQRHQVTELPPIQPYVIEYQCLKVVCPACGEGTRAPLPEEAQGDFGPHLMGAVFAGILCSGRFSAYFKYHKGLSQLCWAHLKRNILGIQEFAKTTDAQRFCRDALALYARLFRLWRKFQGSLINRDQLIARSIPLQQRWFALAEQYLDSDDKEVRNMATALFQHCGRLFTFIEHPGVEPTNNCVEQALRIAVQLRKIIFGNRSAQGEVATARLLTVTQTCRMQGRNALAYLTEAIIRYRRHQSVPSLLPQKQ